MTYQPHQSEDVSLKTTCECCTGDCQQGHLCPHPADPMQSRVVIWLAILMVVIALGALLSK